MATQEKPKHPPGAVTVALVLAIGLCTALNLLTVAVLYDALVNHADAGISENATQILTGWGGGIASIISAVVGYQVGKKDKQPVTPSAGA